MSLTEESRIARLQIKAGVKSNHILGYRKGPGQYLASSLQRQAHEHMRCESHKGVVLSCGHWDECVKDLQLIWFHLLHLGHSFDKT